MSAPATPATKVASNHSRTPGSASSVKRKPPPSLVFRYPEPDPEDPFAPLDKLRFKASNGVVGVLCSDEEECPSTSLSDDEWLTSTRKDKRRSYTLYPSPPTNSVHPYSATPHSRGSSAKGDKSSNTSQPHYRRRTQLPIAASDTASLAPSVPPSLIPDDGRTSTDSSLTGHESDSSVRTKSSSRLSRLLPRSKSKKRTRGDTHSLRWESSQGEHSAPSQGLPPVFTHSRGASSPLPSSLQQATRPAEQPSSPRAPPSAFTTVSNFSNRMAQSSGSITSLATADSTGPSAVPHASRLGVYRSASFKHSMTATPDISSTPHRRTRQTSVSGVPSSLEETRKNQSFLPPQTSLDSHIPSASSSFVVINDLSDESLPSSSEKSTEPLPSSSQPPSALPSPEQLAAASCLHVIAENGVRVSFSDLFTVGKTVVIFLRHFWCSIDHAYLQSLSKELRRVSLPKDVKFVLIGNGSPSIIRSYRQIFQLPVQLYVDTSRRLYDALGMQSLQPIPNTPPSSANPRPTNNGSLQRKRGLKFILRAVRAGMPMWDRSGDLDQLGGEFVFEQGMRPVWAHRMATIDGRRPPHVLIDVCLPPPPPQTESTALEKDLGLVSNPPDSPSSHDSGLGDEDEDSEDDGQLLTLEELLKSDKKQRDSRRGTSLHTALTESPYKLDLEEIQRVESSGSEGSRDEGVEDGVEDCIVNARNPRELLLPMTEEEERAFMENRRRSLLRLTDKKSKRRGFIDETGNITHPLGESPALSPVEETESK